MAKVVKVFENGVERTTLTFRGKEFTLTMLPWEDGKRKSMEKSLHVQIEEYFKTDGDIEEISAIVGDIEYGLDDDIEEALEELQQYEGL